MKTEPIAGFVWTEGPPEDETPDGHALLVLWADGTVKARTGRRGIKGLKNTDVLAHAVIPLPTLEPDPTVTGFVKLKGRDNWRARHNKIKWIVR